VNVLYKHGVNERQQIRNRSGFVNKGIKDTR